mmetsp:Transcript_80457/g.236661  ORF Transcript_80457/g.236661 Transcript_80457/m.236661 type:complete len:84 (-) Transcript_80457:29-280(-)
MKWRTPGRSMRREAGKSTRAFSGAARPGLICDSRWTRSPAAACSSNSQEVARRRIMADGEGGSLFAWRWYVRQREDRDLRSLP